MPRQIRIRPAKYEKMPGTKLRKACRVEKDVEACKELWWRQHHPEANIRYTGGRRGGRRRKVGRGKK